MKNSRPRGRPKPGRWDEVQLCAQALCLEEMLGVRVPAGALFYGQPRRRSDVHFVASLRSETEILATQLHELHARAITPPAEYAPGKCNRCSLRDVCLPEVLGAQRNVSAYLHRAVRRAQSADALG